MFVLTTFTLSKMNIAAVDHTSLTKWKTLKQSSVVVVVAFCFKQNSLSSHTSLPQPSTDVVLLPPCLHGNIPLAPVALEALLDRESLYDQVDLGHQGSLFHPVNIKKKKS